MEKIRDILKKFGIEKYEATNEGLFDLINDEMRHRKNRDLLNKLIFPGSPLVSMIDSKYKKTALHNICYYLHEIKLVEKLIFCGADVNAKDGCGQTPLIIAVESLCTYVRRRRGKFKISKLEKQMQLIKVLIKNKANVHICDDDGYSVLQIVLPLGHSEIIEIFLENYKSPNNENRGGRKYTQIKKMERCRHVIMRLLNESEKCNAPISNFSLLLKFIILQKSKKFDDLFEYIVKNTIYNMNADENGFTLLHLASEYGTPAMITALIAAGADTTIHDKLFNKILPIAGSIIYNRLENLKSFLDNGTYVDIVEENKFEANTPLHYAVSVGNLTMIQILVEKGANVNAISYNRSPLLIACGSIYSRKWDRKMYHSNLRLPFLRERNLESGVIPSYVYNVKIVEYLLENGADMEVKNPRKRTALDQSCKFGNLDIVNLLLSRGAKIKKRGFTTLHYAITGKNPDVVKTIVEKGINVNYVCTRKGTPLQYAIKEINQNCAEIVKILLTYNADVNLPDKRMNSPLHLAFLSDKTDAMIIEMSSSKAGIIKELLNSNANINARDRRGRTPFHDAIHNYILMRDTGRDDIDNPYQMDLEILVAFIVGMIARKKYVSEENLLLLKGKEISKVYDKYQNEINHMKEKVINSLHISYLDILSMDINALGGFLGNDGVIEALSSFEYKNKFPHYGILLKKRIDKGLQRQSLIDIVISLFSEYVEVDLPFELIYQIFRLLNLKDLYFFVKAYAFLKLETYEWAKF